MKAIGKTPVYWIVRIVLSLAIVFILSACAARPPLPAEEGTPTPTLAPTATPPSTPVPVGEIFQASPSFYKELSIQDKEASKHFSIENGKTYLSLGSQKVEVDPLSGGVNIDVNGKPLLVEGTGYTNPLTIRGVGENEGKVFAFAPQTSIKLDEKNEKVFPAHWFEVIKSNHPVDQKASEAEKMKQREVAINDPNKVTLEQVQSGDWAMSVLLSGAMSPSKNTKFTGNALSHDTNGLTAGNATLLYTSDKTPVDFFGVTTFDGKNIGLRPFQVLNPTDLKKPDKSQVLITTVGIGKERLTKEQNLAYLDMVYNTNAEPILVVASTYDPNKAPIRASGTLVDQPSVLVLRQVPGNDPAVVNMPYYKQDGITYYYNDIVNYNETNGIELWQYNFNIPLPVDLQNLIWLAYFS